MGWDGMRWVRDVHPWLGLGYGTVYGKGYSIWRKTLGRRRRRKGTDTVPDSIGGSWEFIYT